LLKPWISPPPPAHDAYRCWLISPGSLTARIIVRCDAFRVERRFQGVRMPSRDEARLVGLRGGELAHVREVVLRADGVPVVFAHSVVAPRDLAGVWRSIGKLGTRPLAAALFADPRVVRFPLEYKCINRHHYLHARVSAAGLEPPRTLWARRSLFRLRGRPLLVTEVFLPSVLALRAKRECA
jgi:chorismate--pyruvate lyase